MGEDGVDEGLQALLSIGERELDIEQLIEVQLSWQRGAGLLSRRQREGAPAKREASASNARTVATAMEQAEAAPGANHLQHNLMCPSLVEMHGASRRMNDRFDRAHLFDMAPDA